MSVTELKGHKIIAFETNNQEKTPRTKILFISVNCRRIEQEPITGR